VETNQPDLQETCRCYFLRAGDVGATAKWLQQVLA